MSASAITIENHRIREARRLDSPNQSERPEGEVPSLLVIHNISMPPGQFGGNGIDELFSNCLNPEEHPFYAEVCDLRVSAHVLIRRDGEVVQYVDFDRQAWHAGASCFAGRQACNDFSIGIELEGTDDMPFTEAQYQCLGALTKLLMREYPAITTERIVGHSDIAPGRKTDPGPCFDWDRLLQLL